MQIRPFAALVLLVPALLAADYQQAVGPHTWSFPRDHGRHDGFRLEWWYFTGNLADDAGRRFGYQLTFFRSQLSPDAPSRPSPWATNNLYFAHAAVADVAAKQFFYQDIASRGREGLASAADNTLNVQLKNWSAILTDNTAALRAATPDFSIDLSAAMQQPVFQGPGGLSRKGPNPGQASYYYSMPTMQTRGAIALRGKTFKITGLSWMDHEFSSNLLADNQTGWDWISLQFLDGRALMLYRLRNTDGTDTRFGSLVEQNGTVRYLNSNDIHMTGSDPAASPSGAHYPQHWHVRIQGIPEIDVHALMPNCELQTGKSTKVTYFEGPIDAVDAHSTLIAKGYLEMTGYAPNGSK
jgi:predicted secreted hydrolase